MFLFAEAHTQTTIDAAELAKNLGPGWFFIVLCFVFIGIIVLGLGYCLYKLGCRLMDRLELFLTGVSDSTTANVKNLETCSKTCAAASTNVENLCDAGHNFANAIQKIGASMNSDVSAECDKIHDKLRTIVSTKG